MTRALVIRLCVAALFTCIGTPARARGADDAARWIRDLYGKPTVTRGNVLVGACLLAVERDWRPDPRWAAGAARRMGFSDETDGGLARPAERGFASRVFARLLELEGGLWMRITGSNGRYAYRELVVLGLMPAGGAGVLLTGDELAGLLLGAERFREKGPEKPPTRGDLL